MSGADPADPTQRAAYLLELHRAGQAPRVIGLALAVAGAGLAIVRAYWLPALPAALPMAVITAALGVMLVGVLHRLRWQWTHRRG